MNVSSSFVMTARNNTIEDDVDMMIKSVARRYYLPNIMGIAGRICCGRGLLMWLGLMWLGLSACKQPNDTKWQYFPDMADGAMISHQMAPLLPPQGAVAMDALIYADNSIEAETAFAQNPIQVPEFQVAFFEQRGKQLYATFCDHCHGVKGMGEGTMTDVYPRAPNLTDAMYVKRKDGFFFHTITFGGALMPSLGHAVSEAERVMIILHVRKLQRQATESPDARQGGQE